MSHFISINSGVVKGPTMSNKDSHHWGHSKGLEPGTKTRYIFHFLLYNSLRVLDIVLLEFLLLE